MVGHDEIDIFQDQDDLETPFRACEDEARWTILTHDLILGKSECILDNLIFFGWNCDIGIERRKRCLCFWMDILGIQAGHGISFASCHIWVVATTRRDSVWRIHSPFVEKY